MNLFGLEKKELAWRLIVLAVFVFLLLCRIVYLNSDLPYWGFNIEERASGYNARNMVLFGDWDSGGGRFQPMAFMPLGNLISFISFSLLGVSLFSLKIPYVLLSLLAFFIFYLVLKKEFGRIFALAGLLFFSSITMITFLNRSAMTENLFLLLMISAMFFYQKYLFKQKNIYLFLFGLFSGLNLTVKINGAYFVVIAFAAIFVMLILRENKALNKREVISRFALGVLLGVGLSLILYAISYRPVILENINASSMSNITHKRSVAFNAVTMIPVILMAEAPIAALLFAVSFFFSVLLYFKRLKALDWLNIIWLVLGALILSFFSVQYKRTIFLYPPLCYLAIKIFNVLWGCCKDMYRKPSAYKPNPQERGRVVLNDLMNSNQGFILCVIFYLLFIITGWYSIGPIFRILPFQNNHVGLVREIFLILMIFIVLAVPCFGLFINGSFQKFKSYFVRFLLYYSFLFFLFAIIASIAANERANINVFNKKALTFYSYDNSRDLGKMLKPAVISGSEQAFRVLGFENRHKFLFNHDAMGVYKEDVDDIINKPEIRFFCLLYELEQKKIDRYSSAIQRIVDKCGQIRLLSTYQFGPQYLQLFDKYPNRPD